MVGFCEVIQSYFFRIWRNASCAKNSSHWDLIGKTAVSYQL